MGSRNSKDKQLTGNWLSSSSIRMRVRMLWTARFSPLHSKLSNNILRETCSYLGDVPTLMATFPNEIRCFDLAKNQWLRPCPLHQHINVNYSSSATFIADELIFVCGGGDVKTCTFHIGHWAYILTVSGAVQELPSMLTGRMYHGIICDLAAEAVYVFGGWHKEGDGDHTALRSCEQFKSNKWSSLPDMNHARYRFTPCWYRSVVYLCGGQTTSVETYNPRLNTFVLKDFSLPEDSSCTAVVDAEVLVVITYNYISKLEHGKFTNTVHSSYRPRSICSPAVIQGTAYLVCHYDCCCRRIDLKTGVAMEIKFS